MNLVIRYCVEATRWLAPSVAAIRTSVGWVALAEIGDSASVELPLFPESALAAGASVRVIQVIDTTATGQQ